MIVICIKTFLSLQPVGPQIAKYELLNIQIKGYDFTVLEEFGKYVHNTADRFGLDVDDAYDFVLF